MVQSLLCLRRQKKQSCFQTPVSIAKEYQPQLQGGKCLETQKLHPPHTSGRSDPNGREQLPGNRPKGFSAPSQVWLPVPWWQQCDVISGSAHEEHLPLPGASCSSFAGKGSLQSAQEFCSFIISFSLPSSSLVLTLPSASLFLGLFGLWRDAPVFICVKNTWIAFLMEISVLFSLWIRYVNSGFYSLVLSSIYKPWLLKSVTQWHAVQAADYWTWLIQILKKVNTRRGNINRMLTGTRVCPRTVACKKWLWDCTDPSWVTCVPFQGRRPVGPGLFLTSCCFGLTGSVPYCLLQMPAPFLCLCHPPALSAAAGIKTTALDL